MNSRWYLSPHDKRPFVPTRLTRAFDYLMLTVGLLFALLKIGMFLRFLLII